MSAHTKQANIGAHIVSGLVPARVPQIRPKPSLPPPKQKKRFANHTVFSKSIYLFVRDGQKCIYQENQPKMHSLLNYLQNNEA